MNQFMIKNNKQTIYAIYHTRALRTCNKCAELIATNILEVAIYLVIPFGKTQSLG